MAYWHSDAKKLLLTLRNFPDSAPFLEPVDWKAMGLKDYPTIVKFPMDLTTMATKLANKEYGDIASFEADFKLIVSNCQTYNAEFSEVFEMAARMNAEFEKLIPSVRDSWREEGRRILHALKKNKNSGIFLEPVDWKALGLTDYLEVIKNRPMDLGTLETLLDKKGGGLQDVNEFVDNLSLIWHNCMIYNADGSEIYKLAAAMKTESDKLVRTSFGGGEEGSTRTRAPKGSKRKSIAGEQDLDLTTSQFPLEDDRREDVLRLGRRFAMLENDFLASAIKFVYAKCPRAIRSVDDDTVDVDMEIIARDTASSNSINQLVKVMLFLQSNPE